MDAVRASMLILPARSSLYANLYVHDDIDLYEQAETNQQSFLRRLKRDLQSPTQLSRSGWHLYAHIGDGLYYSVAAGGRRSLLTVRSGESLCYEAANGKVRLLGRVAGVIAMQSAIAMDAEHVSHLQRVFARVKRLAKPSPPPPPPRIPEKRPVAIHGGQLTWEVLPPGWWKLGDDRPGDTSRNWLTGESYDRIRFLHGLNPHRWYRGSALGRRIYYVALFGRVAAADCSDFGNALYYCRYVDDDDWKSVFRLTKREARMLGAKRIVHRGEWQQRVVDALWPRSASLWP